MELSVDKSGCMFRSKHVKISVSNSQASVDIPSEGIFANEYINCYSILCLMPAVLLMVAYKIAKILIR